MSFSPLTARFILTHSSSPELVAQAAEVLGQEKLGYTPKTPFPAEWVKAQQRRPVNDAAYAARYCADAALHEEIWNSTRRVAVRMAIASSPFLNEDLRLRLLEDPSIADSAISLELENIHRHDNLEGLLTLSKSEPASFFDKAQNTEETSYSFIGLANHPDITPPQLDELVTRALAAKAYWVGEAVIQDRYLFDYCPFNKSTLTIADVLSKVPKSSARSIAALVWEREQLTTPLSVDDAKALVAAAPRPEQRTYAYWDQEPNLHMSPEVLDVFLANPRWCEGVSSYVLSDGQFETFLKNIPWKKETPRLVGPHVNSEWRLRTALAAMPSTLGIDMQDDNWLRQLESFSGDLWPSLIERVSNGLDELLVNGIMLTNGEQIYPPLDVLTATLRTSKIDPSDMV